MTIENAVSHIGALETGLDGDARHGAGSRRDRAQIATHAIGIVGMSDAEADRLFAEFYWYMLQPNAEYRHKWRKGDIVLWDNRCPCIRRPAAIPPTSGASIGARRSCIERA